MANVLHFGDQTFDLPDGDDYQGVLAEIERKGRDGGWFEIETSTGPVRVLLGPGITTWIDERERQGPQVW